MNITDKIITSVMLIFLTFLFEFFWSKIRHKMFNHLRKKAKDDEVLQAKFNRQERLSNIFFKVGYSIGVVVILIGIWFFG